jgi:hypothetical protein
MVARQTKGPRLTAAGARILARLIMHQDHYIEVDYSDAPFGKTPARWNSETCAHCGHVSPGETCNFKALTALIQGGRIKRGRGSAFRVIRADDVTAAGRDTFYAYQATARGAAVLKAAKG